MIRILLTILLCGSLLRAGEPITGVTLLTCEPDRPSFGGTRLDLSGRVPLHLLVPRGTQIEPRQPLEAFVLNCPPRQPCEVVSDAKVTITLDSNDSHGWVGSYEVTWSDGDKWEGKFTAVPGKQKQVVICD
jgi:hypothetical protein